MIQAVQLAIRSIRRSPAFAATTVATLALAAGVNAAIFSVVYGILLKPLPFPEADRLVAVWPGRFQSNQDLLYTREHGRMFSQVAAVAPGWSMSLTGHGEPLKLTVGRVSGNFFDTFGTPPLLGRPFGDEATRPGADDAIVLSYGFWMSRFGMDPGVIGRTVWLDGRAVRIVAVMPRTFDVFGLRSDAYTPLVMDEGQWYHRLGFSLFAGRLAPGQQIEQASQDYRALLRNLRESRPYAQEFGHDAALVDMRSALVGDVRPALLLLGAAAALILLIAAVNLGTLQLTRAVARARDAAIRVALGASRGRIVRDRILDQVILALVGGALGVVLAHLTLPVLVAQLPADTPRVEEIAIDWLVLLAVLGAAVVAGTLAGLAPGARHAARLLSVLRSGVPTEAPGARRARGSLVAAEIALAVVLTIGAGLMLQTLWRLQQVDTGFRPEGVLTLHVQPTGARYRGVSVVDYYERLLEQLRAVPGITAAGAIQHLPFSGYSWVTPLDVEGRDVPAGAAPHTAGARVITPGYFRALGQPLLAGRAIERADAVRADVVVVNESLAVRFFGSAEGALGRKVRSRGDRGPLPWMTIVGVVGNVRHTSLTDAAGPEIYTSAQKNSIPAMMLAVRTGDDPQRLVPLVREAIRAIDPDVPLSDFQTMESRVGRSLGRPRLLLTILGAFAVLGGLLALIGVYGVVTYSVSQRSRELGIRLALGAQRTRIIRGVLREALLYGVAGAAIGVPMAVVSSRLLRNLVFGVSATDPVTYGAIIAAVMVTVVAAATTPALRAARVDPVAALKDTY